MCPWKGARFESDNESVTAAKAINVIVDEVYHCAEDYSLKVDMETSIMPTGLLVIAELHPKKSFLPSFSFRWDEKADSLDVDISGVTGFVEDRFKNEKGDYAGHHPRRVTSGRRTFEADIRIPKIHVFHGRLSFNLVRDMGVKDGIHLGATASDSVDTAQK